MTPIPLRVLILEDREADAELMLHHLRRAGFDPMWERVDTEAEYLAGLTPRLDLILADHSLPEFNSARALRLLQERRWDIPFIVVSRALGEDAAVGAMREGAADYLLKDRLARLGPAVAHALEQKRLRIKKTHAEQRLEEEAVIAAALAHMGRELISSLEAPVLLDRLCQLLVVELDCDCTYALLRHADDDSFVPVAGSGHTSEEWQTARLLRIPRTALPPIVSRLERDGAVDIDPARFPDSPLAQLAVQLAFTRVLLVALRRGAEMIGIQAVCARRRAEPFGEVQRRVAQGSAQLASLALENARLMEELEHANSLKSDFVGAMSHELRTPLNVVMGYTYLLRKKEYGPLTADQEAILEHIDHSAAELRDLINTTLDINRLEAGRLPLQIAELDIADLLREIRANLADRLLKHTELEVRWEVEPQLPGLRTDRAKLEVVLTNLIANALKFTRHGSVTVRAQRRDQGVEVTVADTGIGISQEALAIIFEPFRQLSGTAARRYRGVGLGLYIARRFIELLGGTIGVESTLGEGSTFRVWVPAGVQ